MAVLVVPWLDAAARALIQPASGGPAVDFTQPAGEEALVPASSVSWRVFRNPVALFVGGVAAVILELAEPAVRTGVWEHSSFRTDPKRRLQRTGLAAMITVYGARSQAEAMIAGVVRLHARVTGSTPAGEDYRANDVALLTWVQATAGFGFAEAYHRYVRPLSREELDRLYAEGTPAARLYGALAAPGSAAELQALFESKRSRLEASPIVFEFLDIIRATPVFPPLLRPFQRLLVRAAVETVPGWVRERLGLGAAYGLSAWQAALVRRAGALSDRVLLRSSPAVQSCRRLGLAEDFLYRA
jgi:uncharacterized protein (DUF2236 family)